MATLSQLRNSCVLKPPQSCLIVGRSQPQCKVECVTINVHVWLLSRMCDCGMSSDGRCVLNSLVCYTHLWLARVRGHITCINECDDMRDILTILTRTIVVDLYSKCPIPQIPHYNGGVALHICRAKTVEEFVSETV